MDKKQRLALAPSEQKIITPLARLLMDSPLEGHLLFLQSLGLRFSLSGNIAKNSKQGEGYHRFKIYMQDGDETIEAYEGVSATSARAAICNGLAKFLVVESHDYHTYKALRPDHEKERHESNE